MKNHLKEYKEKLEKGICEYMDMNVTERSADAVRAMLECLDVVEARERHMKQHHDFTHEDAKAWASMLINDDGPTPGTGTRGAHWDIDATTAVAKANGVAFDHITDWCWWIAMNVMYSDYANTAVKYGVGTPDYFADLAKDFLFDPDGPGPMEKLGAYYHGIVCTGEY